MNYGGLLGAAMLVALAGCSDNNATGHGDNMAALPKDTAAEAVKASTNETSLVSSNQGLNVPESKEAAVSDLPDIPGDTIYACDPAMTVSTRFAAQQESSEESAGDDALIVMVNGKAHRAESVPSASGAKYQGADGLTWWTKGKDGTLSDAKGATITTCTEKV